MQWMLPRTDLLKISEEDLSLLQPGASGQQFAADALAQGVRLVVVTRGDEGAQAWTAAASETVPTPEVRLIDTVGAGDTFQAALLAWLAEHDCLSGEACGALSAPQLRHALQFAAGAAAITCSSTFPPTSPSSRWRRSTRPVWPASSRRQGWPR